MSLSCPSRPSLGAALLLSVLVVMQPSRTATAQDKAKEAKKACISGDFVRGVELLSDLYVETGDPNFVFNQGRCFEQNGRYQDALNRFHEFVRKLKDAGMPADTNVERHIADCQAMLDKQAGVPLTGRAAVPAAAGLLTPPAPEPSAPATPPASVEAIAQSAPAATPSGAGLRIAGLATMALGAAGLTTGLILNLKANQLADELERSDLSYSRQSDSTRSSYETWGWVSYGVGAACVAGGAALYFLGRRQDPGGPLAFVPVARPGQVGAAVQGGF
jgi:hypothetical protein